MDFDQALIEFAMDVESPTANYNLARLYDERDNTASGLTHYLKAAERTHDRLLAYECLIRAAGCVARQGGRGFTQSHLLKQAICDLPDRPEAYFFLCSYYESTKSWYDCYTMASIALHVCNFSLDSVIDYPGYNGIRLAQAVSGVHWEKVDQSIETFQELLVCSSEQIKAISQNNLEVLGVVKG